jgi:hypothetical protein
MPLWPAGHFSKVINLAINMPALVRRHATKSIGSSKLLRSNDFAVKPGWPGAVRVGQILILTRYTCARKQDTNEGVISRGI